MVVKARECEAAGRARKGVARMTQGARDAWLTRVIPNVCFLYIYFTSEAGRISWYIL